MADLPNPLTRNEQYLNAIATGDPTGLPKPLTREEVYLNFIAENGTGRGGPYAILGQYDTVAELETAHPTGEAGEAYLIGDPTHVYVWLVADEEWSDAGEFTAVQGPKGDKGDDGTVPIDDTTPASNKVYSSEKVENTFISNALPEYYENEFATSKSSVEIRTTNDSFNILFMTDLHFAPAHSNYLEYMLRDPVFRTIKAAKKFAAELPVEQIVFGGDYIQIPQNYTKDAGISNIAEINEQFDSVKTPFFPIAGNHEQYYSGNTGDIGLTSDEVYQYLLKKWVGRDGIKKVSSKLFYRFDSVNEVCHVFVSTLTATDTKDEILSNFSSIVTANVNNYPYIIYNHFGNTDSGIDSRIVDAIDYIKLTLGKTIIAWISGHIHRDWVRVHSDTLIISLLNSGFYNNEQGQDGQTYTKVTETSSESAFSVLTIVPATGKLFVTRFGSGIDMECNYNNISGQVGRIGYLPARGNILDGINWTDGVRLTSSGETEEAAGYSTTDFIPNVYTNDVLYFADGTNPVSDSDWTLYDDDGQLVKNMPAISSASYGATYTRSRLFAAGYTDKNNKTKSSYYHNVFNSKGVDPNSYDATIFSNATFWESGYLKSIVWTAPSTTKVRFTFPTAKKETIAIQVNEPFNDNVV